MIAQAVQMPPQSKRPSGRGARSADRPVSTSADLLRFATAYHAPVMAAEVAFGLVTDRSGLYVDATLGGGGHSASLLDALSAEAQIIGIDQDAEAIAFAESRLADAIKDKRFRALQANFAHLETVLESIGISAVDGVLLDLGVSSHQVDEPARGFSFSAEGPLDMRMNADSGESASEFIARLDVQSLTDILRAYGEEPRAWPIANAIVAHGRLTTSEELADIVRETVPQKYEVKTLARVFQAIRIAVNDELGSLEHALHAALEVLRPGGRLAVISYHSLEDRRAKHFLRFGNLEGRPEKDFYGNLVTPWRLLSRKPILATPEEIEANPRARSARLRISEKQAQPTTDYPRQRKT